MLKINYFFYLFFYKLFNYFIIGQIIKLWQKLFIIKSESENNNKVDSRHKINLYLEKLAKNFQKYYVLGQNATIEESLLLFKGRNNMKFYIPMKPHKYGFKIHFLCDSDTNQIIYIICFLILEKLGEILCM